MYGPPDEFITAGWYAELDNVLDWTQFNDGARERTMRKLGDKTAVWDPPLEGIAEEIIYNPKIFEKAGVTVPASRQFTSDEFYDVCVKLRQAGFDPFAQGVGDRNYPGRGIFNDGFLTKLGAEDARKLMTGQLAWDTPAVKEVLDWGAKLSKIPVMPPNFSTMKLAESHTYFHTPPPGKDLPRAAMFLVGAWYTGRALQPPEKGGQPKDFRLSFLRYPTFKDGKAPGAQWGGGGSGGGSVAAQSKIKDAAFDAVRGLHTVKYGSIWLGLSYVPTELKVDSKLIPDGGYQWYAEEYAKTHQDVKWVTSNFTIPPALDQAITAAYNEGLPSGQIDVAKAIELLEKGRTAK